MKKSYTTPYFSKETFNSDVMLTSCFEKINSPDYSGDVF